MKTNILLSKLNFDQVWAKSLIEKELLNCKKVVVVPFSYWDSEVYDLDSWNSVYSPNKKYFEEIFLPFSSYGFDRSQFKYIPESVKFNPIKIPLISHFTRISAILKPQISSPIG